MPIPPATVTNFAVSLHSARLTTEALTRRYPQHITLSSSSIHKCQQMSHVITHVSVHYILEINSTPRMQTCLGRRWPICQLGIVRFQVVNEDVVPPVHVLSLGKVWRHTGNIVRMKSAERLDRLSIVRILMNQALRRLERHVFWRHWPPSTCIDLWGAQDGQGMLESIRDAADAQTEEKANDDGHDDTENGDGSNDALRIHVTAMRIRHCTS